MKNLLHDSGNRSDGRRRWELEEQPASARTPTATELGRVGGKLEGAEGGKVDRLFTDPVGELERTPVRRLPDDRFLVGKVPAGAPVPALTFFDNEDPGNPDDVRRAAGRAEFLEGGKVGR